MNIRLHLSAAPEELLGKLRSELHRVQGQAAAAAHGVPRRIPVLVPTGQVGDWVQVGLARDIGISMGFEFLQASAFLSQGSSPSGGIRGLAEANAFWSPGSLRWRLLPLVRGIAARLGHDESKPLSPRSEFAFACLLAEAFDRYGRYRPDWMEKWVRGVPIWPADSAMSPDAHPAESEEDWQRALWKTIAEEAAVPPHPAVLLRQRDTRVDSAELDERHVFVLITDALDPLTLQALGRLSEHGTQVSMHVLLPSLGFLGDIGRRRALLEMSKGSSGAALDGLESFGAHPLLSALGQQAVGTFLLLGSVSPDYAEWPSFSEPSADAGGSLLRQLQHGIHFEQPPAGQPADPGAPDLRSVLPEEDRSIAIHSCHSPRRELEVLRDELLRAFDEIPGLRPDEVLVGVSDFDAYASLALGILGSGERPLPVRLTAVPARQANPIATGLVELLSLSLGRNCASEIIELLNHPAVRQRLGAEDDPEVVLHLADLVRTSGLTYGCERGEDVAGDETGSWRSSIDRILGGYWFGEQECVHDAAGQLLHPVASALQDLDESEARFVAWLTELARHLCRWREPATAVNWAARLSDAADSLLYSEALDDDAAALRRMLTELSNVSADTLLDGGTIMDWLNERLENSTSLRTSIGGEILVGRLDQVHALPCRVLAILGLQDGAFPRANRRPGWDLIACRPERWDPDLRKRDRQLFLDALLAPTDRLILSAANRSVHTGHDGPLSSCVEELLRAISNTVRVEDGAIEERLVIKHRLQPFAPDYFNGRELPRSFNALAARIATDLQRSQAQAPHLQPFLDSVSLDGSADSGVTEAPVITIDDLVSFWKDPARAWLRVLRVEVQGEEKDDTQLDQPPVTLDPLQHYQLRAQVWDAELACGADASTLLASRLAADRCLPPGAVGELLLDLQRQEFGEVKAVVRGLLDQCERLNREITLDGGMRLQGEVLLARSRDWALLYRPGTYDRPTHQLAPFIHVLFASLVCERPVGCHAIGDMPAKETLRAGVDPSFARRQLSLLVEGFLAGQAWPLGYAPLASQKLAGALTFGEEKALAAARDAWLKTGADGTIEGEGGGLAASLAWRDVDPFAPPHAADWIRWARQVAGPLETWWNQR